MDYFEYHNKELQAEDIKVAKLAEQFGTPLFIYSKKTILRHWHAFNNALGSHPHLICYAVKANSNLAILKVLAELGSGFDVVSIGELHRVIKAGGDPKKVVFSGVGKTTHEITEALDLGIYCINVESISELRRIELIAQSLRIKAPVSLRINPDIDAKTHPYISTGLKENKFGIEFNKAKEVYLKHEEFPHIQFVGIDCHIGSQLTELNPYLEVLDKLLSLADELKEAGLDISHLDLGGGLGVTYKDEKPPLPNELAEAVQAKMAHRDYEIILEPGRAIMANAGILVTEVEYIKEHHGRYFAIVDAAMNDLLRPALYQAWQNIIPVHTEESYSERVYDVVGPVCESGDFLGKERALKIGEGSLLAVRGAGAYGATMSSNYNSRPRACEILVDGDKADIIRHRETFDDLIHNECLL